MLYFIGMIEKKGARGVKEIAYIVGAGAFCPRALTREPGSLLIAADGGYDSLMKAGLRPDVVIGDMDSNVTPVAGVPLLRFPVRKNDTDLSLALKFAAGKGFRSFRLYGADGGEREDHFLGALQLLAKYSQNGADIRLISERFTLYALTDASILLPTRPGQTVSIFSHSPLSLGVTLKGLSYEGENLRLRSSFPLGVSNAAAGSRALIAVKKGTLLIYQEV